MNRWDYLDWKKAIREVVLAEAYHRGINLKYEHIARYFPDVSARRICEVAESIGHPVWTSAPDEAWKPL